MTYNITLGSNAGIYDLIKIGNDAVSGLLVGGLVMALFFIILFRVATRGEDFIMALAVASFPAFLLSSIFTFIDLLGFIYPIAFLTITAFSVFVAYVRR